MNKIDALIKKGVAIASPHSVEIGQEVDIDRISSENVVLYAGTKLFGAMTFIAEGARIGYEAPATVENCYIGPHVELKGGFFKDATFLKASSCGSGSHVREGTILEEQASIAHTVGLKQTILFPYVTLGSLINFCDCLMAGGTSRKNHSEVGSSYIHFNYTPNQDKATPSIMGDVPRGVMLNQSPIFLGGQGGLVGPTRLNFGTVVAAGSICRNDQLKENLLIFEGTAKKGSLPYKPSGYRNVKRLLLNNFNYMGNLVALQRWYRQVRSRFIGQDLPQTLYEGLVATVNKGIEERAGQLEKLYRKMGDFNTAGGMAEQFRRQWPVIKTIIEHKRDGDEAVAQRDIFVQAIEKGIREKGKDYLAVIHGLDDAARAEGTAWLCAVVEGFIEQVGVLLPGLA